jgi:hypothetical protein
MEKVLSEWKIVETDEGYRIEIKGDKQAMREWVERFRKHGPMRGGHRMHFGPWGAWGRHGFEFSGGCCEQESDEDKKE